MRRMDRAKLLICGVATALVASHANEDQRPECGIEIAGKPCACLERHPTHAVRLRLHFWFRGCGFHQRGCDRGWRATRGHRIVIPVVVRAEGGSDGVRILRGIYARGDVRTRSVAWRTRDFRLDQIARRAGTDRINDVFARTLKPTPGRLQWGPETLLFVGRRAWVATKFALRHRFPEIDGGCALGHNSLPASLRSSWKRCENAIADGLT